MSLLDTVRNTIVPVHKEGYPFVAAFFVASLLLGWLFKPLFWVGLILWSGGSAALWAGLALWRMMTMDPYNFFLLFVLGVFQLVVVGRILIQPRAGHAS